LASNLPDGKLVPLPDFNWEIELANTIKLKDTGLEKDEAMQLEWQYLLEAHLETQKRFFEERVNLLEHQNQSKIKHLEQEFAELLEEKMDTARRMEIIERQKKTLEKKTHDLEKKMVENSKETEFIKSINDQLEKNQSMWKQKIQETEEKFKQTQIEAAKDEKIRELEEQVRDLMFYIEAQKELAAKSEFVDGQVVVVPSSSPQVARDGAGKGLRGRGRRKKK